jgi:hypothetical protein
MSISILLVAALTAPAMPQPFPWIGQVQTLVCSTVTSERTMAEYVLTLTDTDGFIVGEEPDQALQMGKFVSFEAMPPVARGQAVVRRLNFPVDSETAFVRQLYRVGEHVSTFINVGKSATSERDLPFETIAGFCEPAETLNSEATQ